MRSTLTRLLASLPLVAAPLAAQDDHPAPEPASPEQLTALLDKYESAVQGEEALRIASVLEEMAVHDNPELLDVAVEGLKYKASSKDRKLIKELAEQLGEDSKGDLERLLAVREAEVQANAVRLLGNLSGNKAAMRTLSKTFKDKNLRKSKPTVIAATIDAYGRLADDSITDDVSKLLTKTFDPDLSKACVRYFGQTDCRDYDIVRDLIQFLGKPPNTQAVNGVPSEAGRLRRERWMRIRKDVSWSLEKITGQAWTAANADVEGDKDKALEYVKKNKRELGLK